VPLAFRRAGSGDGVRNQRMSQLPESTSPSLAASLASLPGSAAGSVSVNEAPQFEAGRLQAGQTQGDGTISISESVLEPPGLQVATEGHPQRIPRWLERSELFLRVLLRMYIGLAVCYAPWSRLFWDQNPLFVQFPTLSIYAANGAVRGIISGLGLLNLWIAFHDAFRRRGD
jgi:hypothetical protein